MAYRYTKESRFLDYATNVTQYYIANLPSASVPLWDFDAPASQPYRDTSAAAITSSALLELVEYVEPTLKPLYLETISKQMAALSSPAYSYIGDLEASFSVLSHNRHDCGLDGCAVVESDYYYLEALLRMAATQG